MRQDKASRPRLVLYLCGAVPVIWLALLLAPYMGGGLAGLLQGGGAALASGLYRQLSGSLYRIWAGGDPAADPGG